MVLKQLHLVDEVWHIAIEENIVKQRMAKNEW